LRRFLLGSEIVTADYTIVGTPLGETTVTPVGSPLPSYYTSQAEIERMWSLRAAALHVSDYDSEETAPVGDIAFRAAVWDDILCAATDEVNFYLLKFHEASDLYSSRWVRTRATWIGCYLLSLRRGDPGYFKTLYDQAIAQLERINESNTVPRLTLNQNFTPALSNIRIDDRFRVAKERVEPTISTGGTSGRQDLDPDLVIEPFNY
jgi:hypothetical protein